MEAGYPGADALPIRKERVDMGEMGRIACGK